MDLSYLQTFLEKFEHLKIKLEDIETATNNFDDKNNLIGVGGFGNVYKGEVSHSKGRSMVAIKRLDPKRGQGIPEFLKEISMLSSYTHENLISLLGFCCEAKEMILVYELAPGGSLDHHLNSPHLTWTQRLKICLDAAKGLSYLHDPREMHQRLIHCDIKSGNILLDDKWNAKISDFGLSTMGSANEQQSVIVTLAAGTMGYIDPQYLMTNTLTKESDVYSFGVVLFEVLCGKSCCTYKNGHVKKIFVPTWIQSCEKKELYNIIFNSPNIQPMDQFALARFSDITYRCLKLLRADRPNMAEVVTELESVLEIQDYSENKLVLYYKEISKSAQPSLNYMSNGELVVLMSKGVLLNGGKTWFSINEKGEHCEMISFAECLDSGPSKFDSSSLSSEYNSRFVVDPSLYKNPSEKSDEDSGQTYFSLITNAVIRMFNVVPSGRINFSRISNPVKRMIKVVRPEKGSHHIEDWILKTHVRTQFLSPGITYTVNLVFKFNGEDAFGSIMLHYKLKGETKTSVSYPAVERKDGWFMAELYQLTSEQRTVDLEILFGAYHDAFKVIHVQGIEFWPLEKVEYKDEKHSIPNSVANRKNRLPPDYEHMMRLSKDWLEWKTKKEAYSILRKGFLIDKGETWFSIDKNGKKWLIISARALCLNFKSDGRMFNLPESRFGEAFKCSGRFYSKSTVKYDQLSFETTYGLYLVYRLPKDQSKFEGPMTGLKSDIYLVNPLTPVIRPKADQNTHNPVNMLRYLRIKGLPQQRDDCWMEVQIWEFKHENYSYTNYHDEFRIESPIRGTKLRGLIVEGLELRPI